MTILPAVIVLASLLLVTIAVGVVIRWRQLHSHARANVDINANGEAVEPARLGAASLGERATLLQFSTEDCTRGQGAHEVLTDLAASRPGVLHLNIDLTDRPDIARHFDVMQTPTTLILDSRGVIQTRIGGIPAREVVELELARLAPVRKSRHRAAPMT